MGDTCSRHRLTGQAGRYRGTCRSPGWPMRYKVAPYVHMAQCHLSVYRTGPPITVVSLDRANNTPRLYKYAGLVPRTIHHIQYTQGGVVLCFVLFFLAVILWRFNTLRVKQNSLHFAEDILWCIFMNEKFCIRPGFHLSLIHLIRRVKVSIGSDNGLVPDRRQNIGHMT